MDDAVSNKRRQKFFTTDIRRILKNVHGLMILNTCFRTVKFFVFLDVFTEDIEGLGHRWWLFLFYKANLFEQTVG